jgi:hypothetical protein
MTQSLDVLRGRQTYATKKGGGEMMTEQEMTARYICETLELVKTNAESAIKSAEQTEGYSRSMLGHLQALVAKASATIQAANQDLARILQQQKRKR